MTTRLEAIQALLRVSTIYNLKAERGDESLFVIGQLGVLAASEALTDMTDKGIITRAEGKKTISDAIYAAMIDPAYQNEHFQADEQLLNEHIGLVTAVPSQPEIAKVINDMERSYVRR